MTAAHCIIDETVKPRHISAWNGPICDKHLLRKTKPLQIRNIIKHEEYYGIHSHNDIALLELMEPLSFNSTFNPVCLPNFESYKNFFAAGWGLVNRKSFFGTFLEPARCLYEAELTPNYWINCKKLYSVNIPDQTLCAGGKTNVCMGDSGGPLMSRKFGRVYAAGITSYGTNDCGTRMPAPSVFEKTVFHQDWILKHTSNANWCDGPAQMTDM